MASLEILPGKLSPGNLTFFELPLRLSKPRFSFQKRAKPIPAYFAYLFLYGDGFAH